MKARMSSVLFLGARTLAERTFEVDEIKDWANYPPFSVDIVGSPL